MIKVNYDNYLQKADLDRSSSKNFTDDPTLETTVFLSLFTRRLAAKDDALPDVKGTREGWWADPYNNVPGDLIGSRLWLLNRGKMSSDITIKAQNYALEALQWLIDDGIASSINVVAERSGSLLLLRVSVIKPTNPTSKWDSVWKAHLALL